MTASLDDVKNRIKSRVPLDQLIGETVTLVRRGSSITACCPFHAEKSPSFYIYPDQHYYCFGCKESGDAITFVRKTREFSFIETLKFLASKYGIEAPELEESDALKRRRGEQAALAQMMIAAQDLYVSELQSPRGEEARAYLRSRGFTDENISKFGFGLTPVEAFGLVKHLRGLGFREDDMTRASLVGISAKSGRPYDFFRERIMIPIRDVQGRVIAFGGRTTNNDPAKYKNSGATPLFDKSGVLFGLDAAREAIKNKRRAIIVEGYMDALCLWQEGIQETIASMGTALTVRQLKLLHQQTKVSDVVILFDGDQAGQKATLVAIEVVLEVPELSVKAARLTNGDDPDTFVRKNGAEALGNLIAQASDLIDVVISARLQGANMAAIPTIVSQEFVPWLVKISDQMKRGYLVSKVASITGISTEMIHAQIRSLQFNAHSKPNFGAISGAKEALAAKAALSKSSSIDAEPIRIMPSRVLTPVEKGVLGHLYFSDPQELDLQRVEAFLAKELPLEPLWELFAKQLLKTLASGLSPQEDPTVLAAFSREELSTIALISELPPQTFASLDRKKEMERLIIEQNRNNIQQSINLLKRQVQVASSQSPQDVPSFLSEVMQLSQSLSNLDRALAKLS